MARRRGGCGGGFRFWGVCAGLFASKPAPTVDRVVCTDTVRCGSGLAREDGSPNNKKLPRRQQLQRTPGIRRHFFITEMRLQINPFDIRLSLVVIVAVERHAALADRVDGQAVCRVGEVDQPPGRGAIRYWPWRRANLGREVVRYFVTAGSGERADVE